VSTIPGVGVGGSSGTNGGGGGGASGLPSIEDMEIARSGAEVIDLLATGAAAVVTGTALARAAKRRTETDED
jgi:hypothetical protein